MSADCRKFKPTLEQPCQRHFWSRQSFVEWINRTLSSNYKIAELQNGAPYLHLLDALYPDVVPVESVKFDTNMPYDCFQNFQLLKATFKKIGIQKDFDMDALIAGRHKETCTFLNWFKFYFIDQKEKVNELKSKIQITETQETFNTEDDINKDELDDNVAESCTDLTKPDTVPADDTISSEKIELNIPYMQIAGGEHNMLKAIIEDYLNNHRHERDEYFKRFHQIIINVGKTDTNAGFDYITN